MTLNVALIMKMDAGQAKTELRAVQGEVVKTGAAAKGLAAEAKGAGAAIDGLRDQSGTTAEQLKALADAELAVARASTGLVGGLDKVQAGGFLAGNSARMFSQQLSQVGQQTMATGQFVNALAIQLPDIGIAFGAVGGVVGLLAGIALPLLVNAFGGTAEKAISMMEGIDALTESVKSYDLASKRARMSTAEMQAEFGTASPAIRTALIELANIEKIKAFDTLKATSAAMRDLVLDVGIFADVSGASAAQDFLGLGNMLSSQRELGRQFEENLETLRRTEDPAVRLGAALDLRAQMDAAIGGYDAMNAEQRELYEGLTQVVVQMETLGVKSAETSQVAGSVASIIEQFPGLLGSATSQAGGLAAAMSGVAANAWDAAKAIAAARSQAALQSGLNYGKIQNRGESGPEGAQRAAIAAMPDLTPTISTGAAGVYKASAAGGGGGASAAKAEKDAVAELITKLREEQEVLRATDPVQAQMLKYRKQLSEASAGERLEVESLIRAEQQLKSIRAVEDFASQTTADFLDAIIVKGASAEDALKGLLSQIIKVGIQALMLGQGPLAGILGIQGGLFSGLFGGGGGGGTGGLGLPMPFANGTVGLITGAGGPRDDKILARVSAGESIMTGDATRRYRPILERMNAGGDIPGFARGMIGAAPGPSFSGGGGNVYNNYITVPGAVGDNEIYDLVARAVSHGIKHNNREMVPLIVKDTIRHQRVAGR